MREHLPTSIFVWYHADKTSEANLRTWMQYVQQTLAIKGRLYHRQQDEKTTFMEVFECVGFATIEKIEQLAAQQPCFHGITRRCESFERITT